MHAETGVALLDATRRPDLDAEDGAYALELTAATPQDACRLVAADGALVADAGIMFRPRVRAEPAPRPPLALAPTPRAVAVLDLSPSAR